MSGGVTWTDGSLFACESCVFSIALILFNISFCIVWNYSFFLLVIFSALSSLEVINGFIYNALGLYGISEFSDRVLDETMTEMDKAAFDLIEAKELFQATS